METHTTAASAPQAIQVRSPQGTSTNQDVEHFKQLFNATDSDGSGNVDLKEFGEFLEYARQQLDPTQYPFPDVIVDQLMQQADTSGDGVLDEGEFVQFLDYAMDVDSLPVPKQTTPAPLPNEAVTPGDGIVTDPNDEIGCCACTHGEIGELEAFFAEYDTGYGANVDSQNKMIEFRNWLQHTKDMNLEQANTAMLSMTEVQAVEAGSMPVAPQPIDTPITPMTDQVSEHSAHAPLTI